MSLIKSHFLAYQNTIIETGIVLLIEGLCFLGGNGPIPRVDLIWIPEILRKSCHDMWRGTPLIRTSNMRTPY